MGIKRSAISIKALLAVIALGALSAGCSPRVPDYTGEMAYEDALSSYETCVDRLYPTGRGYECDRVSATSGLSRDQYIYGNSSAPSMSRSYYNQANFYKPEEAYPGVYNDAWRNYLSSLDPQTLNEMAWRWQEIQNNYSY